MIVKHARFSGLLLALLGVACGEDATQFPPGPMGTGGASSGGASSGGVTGASGASTGGAQGAGASSGGALGNGGTGVSGASSGGAPSAGSTNGGATSGGAVGNGGSTTGGSAGKASSGGASSGGSAGSSSAGAAGSAPTTGCGKSTWPPGDGTTLLTIDVGGTARQYILSLPTGYDTNKPYRVIYAWHGRTGTAAQIAGGGTRGFYGLKSLLPDSIFVAGQGLGTTADPADTGWPNTNGQDIAMVKALVAYLGSNYCVDANRIMSTGFSYGGIMSDTIGCQMSDVFRAIAPIAGAYFGGRNSACNTHPIAYWGAHGTADDQVTYASGETARDLFLTTNHCTMTTQPTEPSPCVAYDGCDSGYPVHWCSHAGTHMIPSFASAGIAAFFKQF
jgi:poly(3-hydroxybutyrate) depolymerase